MRLILSHFTVSTSTLGGPVSGTFFKKEAAVALAHVRWCSPSTTQLTLGLALVRTACRHLYLFDFHG
jgi:hypothetical protein